MIPKNDRLDDLVQRHLEGQATSEEYQELANRLAQNPEARRRFAAHVQMHALLEWEAGTVPIREVLGNRAKSLRLWRMGPLAAVLLLGLSLLLFWPEVKKTPTKEELQPIGKLTRFPAGIWMNDNGPKVGDDIFPGSYLLVEGNAEIRFATGRVVLIEAPAQMDMLQEDRIVLHRGWVVTRGTSPEKGFTIETAVATILEYGSELGVAVAGSGETVVQVFEGKATSRLKGQGQPSFDLNAGQALQIDGQTLEVRDLPFDSQRFIRELPDRGERAYTWLPPYNRSQHEAMPVLAAPATIRIDGVLKEWDPTSAISACLQEPFSQSFNFTGQMMYDENCL